MTRTTVPRRNLLTTGACALLGAATLPGLVRASASGCLRPLELAKVLYWG